MSNDIEVSTSPPDLHSCISFADNVGYHIHPNKLLQLLEQHARVHAERTAKPGLSPTETELIRGQRLEALSLVKQIREALNKWQQQI